MAQEDLSTLSFEQLKEKAKALNIKIYRTKKVDLIKKIQEASLNKQPTNP